MAGAAKKLSATYEFSFLKHAPIGPTMAVADARPDGTVHIYTHNQNPQALRGEIAQMLGASVDHVVVRTFAGAGHYGRSNGGNAGRRRRSGHPVESALASPCACSGCVRTTSSGPRSRRLRWPTSKSAWMRTARWWPIRWTTTCPRCRTTGLWARCSRDCLPWRRPARRASSSARR